MPRLLKAQGGPQYVLGDTLGAGGMGVVHRGTMVTPAGERAVAIKLLVPRSELTLTRTDLLIAEARLAFQLTHANICQVLDLGLNDDGAFMVMELVEGLDLDRLLGRLRPRGRRLEVASAMHIARELAKALDYSHRKADAAGRSLLLIHGDVTPRNTLISNEGEVKLGDFGIARALSAAAPGNRLRGGTPGYMAPESLTDEADHRADIYALGVTLLVALGGAGPRDHRVDVRGLLERRPEVGSDLAAIIERATRASPADRWASARDVERELAFLLARRYPTFTPTMLGDLVREHGELAHVAPPSATSLIVTGSAIVSIARSDVVTKFERPAATSDSRSAAEPRQTEPYASAGQRRGPRRWLLGAAVVLTATVVALAGKHAGWIGSSSRTAGPPIKATERPAYTSAASVAGPLEPPEVDHVDRLNVSVSSPDGPAAVSFPDDPAAVSPPERSARKGRSGRSGNVRRRNAAARQAARSAAPTQPVRGAPAVGYLTVNAVPWGAVYIDGKRVAEQTPVYRLPVAAGQHRITVFNPDRASHSAPRSIEVKESEVATVGFKW